MSSEAQIDIQTLVTENTLLIAEDGIRELRVKGGVERLGRLIAGLDYGYADSFVGII